MRSLWSIREILFPINRFVSSLISTIIEKSKAYLRVSKNKKRKKEKILDLHFRLRSENRVKKIFPSLKVKRIYIYSIYSRKRQGKEKKIRRRSSRETKYKGEGCWNRRICLSRTRAATVSNDSLGPKGDEQSHQKIFRGKIRNWCVEPTFVDRILGSRCSPAVEEEGAARLICVNSCSMYESMFRVKSFERNSGNF